MENEQKKMKISNIVIIGFVVFLLSSVITGVGVYLWRESANKDAQAELNERIDRLENDLEEMNCDSMDENSENNNQSNNNQNTTNPTASCEYQDFEYINFSFTYPCDWKLSSLSDDVNFPLKDRLEPLYSSDKVVALEKQGLYLIVTIESGTEGSAGGIFLNDSDYNNFIKDKDSLSIQNSEFYLSKSHSKISSLSEDHEGPYMWSSLTEYFPQKTTESGKVYKGYENVIHKNGYSYNFIVTSSNGGDTNASLQKELLDILETINW